MNYELVKEAIIKNLSKKEFTKRYLSQGQDKKTKKNFIARYLEANDKKKPLLDFRPHALSDGKGGYDFRKIFKRKAIEK